MLCEGFDIFHSPKNDAAGFTEQFPNSHQLLGGHEQQAKTNRPIGGNHYKRLEDAFARLQGAQFVTIIKSGGKIQTRIFSLIDEGGFVRTDDERFRLDYCEVKLSRIARSAFSEKTSDKPAVPQSLADRLRAGSKALEHDEIAARLAAIRQGREVEKEQVAQKAERLHDKELELEQEREAEVKRERGPGHEL